MRWSTLLLLEEAVIKPLETCSMTSFVLGHLVHAVVDGTTCFDVMMGKNILNLTDHYC